MTPGGDPLRRRTYERRIEVVWATLAGEPMLAEQYVWRIFRADGTYRVEVMRTSTHGIPNVRADGLYQWAEGEYEHLGWDESMRVQRYRLWQYDAEQWSLRFRRMVKLPVEQYDLAVIVGGRDWVRIGNNLYTVAPPGE